MHWDPGSGEVYDLVLGGTIGSAVADVVGDFVDRAAIRSRTACGENIWHKCLSLNHPTQSAIEILLGEEKHVTSISSGYHGKLIQVYAPSRFIMQKLRVVDDRGLAQRPPIVNRITIVLCDLKLAT